MQEIEFNIPQPPQKRRYTPAQRAAALRARKKRRAARRRKQIAVLAVAALVLGLLIFGLVKGCTAVVGAIQSIEWQSASVESNSQTGADVDVTLPDAQTAGDDADAQLSTQSDISDSVSSYGNASYDVSDYVYDAGDARLLLVNGNLPLGDGYFVKTAVADDATGITLETEAAESYRAMATAAAADGISLVLTAGYHDADAQQAIFDACQQTYIDQGYSEDEAYALAESIVALPSASEHLTGYGADILSADYLTSDIGYADTEAFAWLERYAADYGFILRYPEDKQMITGRAYEPWHWRYVGADNAKAIVESGLTLEEFIEAAQ